MSIKLENVKIYQDPIDWHWRLSFFVNGKEIDMSIESIIQTASMVVEKSNSNNEVCPVGGTTKKDMS